MKNVLFVIVDSLSFDRINNFNQNIRLTPFLDSIKSQCITTDNLFSQGPYTEAGTKGLLCCCNTLDNGGYFCRYDSQERFITDFFKEFGYETYNVNSPSYLLSKRTLENIDHMIFTSGFDCRFLWSQRFSFYYDRWSNGNFTAEDYTYLSKFVELVFESAEDFLSDVNCDEKYDLISHLIDFNVLEKNRNILYSEKEKFYSNKKEYLDSVFDKKLSHPIFLIENIKLNEMINTDLINSVLKKKKHFVSKLKRVQFQRNLQNNHCIKGALIRALREISRDKKPNKKNCGEYINRLRNLISGREVEVYQKGLYYTKDPYKLVPSAKTQMDYAVSILKNKNDKNKFVFIHPEEAHYFNTFFTYDSNDEALVESEFSEAELFVAQIDKNYKGSLFYDLSVRYIDHQIEELYSKLQEADLLKDTIVVITSDHGSSYFFDPIRKSLVNNFHSDNYHVPMYIFGGGVTPKECTGMYMSKDIIPTIADLLGKKMTGDYNGNSMLDDNYNAEDVFIEYMGPGCPDIRLKPVWLSSRSRKYAVSFIGMLNEPFSEKNICEIYDLCSDRNERYNIRDHRNKDIELLIEKIHTRFEELRIQNGFA